MPLAASNFQPASPAAASPRQNTSAQLLLRARAFDPLAHVPAGPAVITRADDGQPGLRLVQFPGPIQDDWYTGLLKAGLEVVSYMPDYAYLVWGDGAAVAQLQTATPVRWAGLYQPWYALHPDLADAKNLPAAVDVTVQVYARAGADEIVNAILAKAQRVLAPDHAVLLYRNIGLTLASDQLAWLAALPGVVNVEPRLPRRKMDELQGQIMAGHLNAAGTQPTGAGYLNWLTATVGFTTSASAYPIVDVTDDGIDNGTATPLHADFWTFGLTNTVDRLIYNYNWTTDAAADGKAGHGNINASIVAGYNDQSGATYEDASGYNYGLGINPFGRVAGSKVFANSGSWSAPATNTPLISTTYALGARISSNSWGSDVAGAYTTDSQEYDVLARDAQPGAGAYAGNQEIAIVFAAGNAGSSANTVGSPGTAKNVITVGAAENVRPTWTDGCAVGPTGADSAQDIIGFSSRGPADDSRVKPDLVAPGTHIEGAASQANGYDGTGVCDQFMPVGQTLYAASSGTSHSTPAIAGAASLLYRYYQDHFGGQPPSPAMTKAYLINATRYMTGVSANDTLPSNNQGYGEINLGLAFDAAQRLVVDQSQTFGASGEVYRLSGATVDANKPFRVTLAWTDAPGPTTGNAYVNNLDLAVTVGTQTFLGNRFSGGTSVSGGSADPRNNVESVFLPAGTSGAFTIVITATNIAGDGVPGNADPTDQDFALVVHNGTQFLGMLQGVIRAAGSGSPIAGATVQAESAQGSGLTTSDAGGLYHIGLVTGTYVVTASAYGYQPSAVSGVVVATDVTTTQDITLSPIVDYYVISGTVTDAATGWPLYASLSIPDYPNGDVWTDPATGFYSVTLPGGFDTTLNVSAWITGYLPVGRAIGPLTADRTENFALAADPASCVAPGRRLVGWSENFDSVAAPSMPAGWVSTLITSTATAATWRTSVNSVQPPGITPRSAPNLALFNSFYAQNGGASRLYRTTGLNMPSMPTTTLSLWMYHDLGYATDPDRVQVQVSTNGGVNWVNAGSPIVRYDGTTGWKQHFVDLSAYAAQADLRLGLLGISDWGNDIHIDDLSVMACQQQAGGLVVGNAYDLGTDAPLTGVLVQGAGQSALTTATSDPNVPDSFYTLFSPAGTQTFTATKMGYNTEVITANVILNAATRVDWNLLSVDFSNRAYLPIVQR